MLLRAILCGGVWNGFFLGEAKKEDVPCRFCGERDGDGHLFWECTFQPLQHVRDLLEFAHLFTLDRSKWPRCLLWHGWLIDLSGISDKDPWASSLPFVCTRDPWATSFGDLASFHLERCLAAHHDIALEMTDHPDIWTDGSREEAKDFGGLHVEIPNDKTKAGPTQQPLIPPKQHQATDQSAKVAQNQHLHPDNHTKQLDAHHIFLQLVVFCAYQQTPQG